MIIFFFSALVPHILHPHPLHVPFHQAQVQVTPHQAHVVPLLVVQAVKAQVAAVVKALHQAVVDPAQYHVLLAAVQVVQVLCCLDF